MRTSKGSGGGLIVESAVHFGVDRRGRKRSTGATTEGATGTAPVPRIARSMALAIVMDEMLRTGVVEDCAELARIAGVTRARVSQVMALCNLAPDLQEGLLETGHLGRAGSTERKARTLACSQSWEQQRAGLLAIR